MEELRYACSSLNQKVIAKPLTALYQLLFNALPLKGNTFFFIISSEAHVDDFSPYNQHTRVSPIITLHFHTTVMF